MWPGVGLSVTVGATCAVREAVLAWSRGGWAHAEALLGMEDPVGSGGGCWKAAGAPTVPRLLLHVRPRRCPPWASQRPGAGTLGVGLAAKHRPLERSGAQATQQALGLTGHSPLWLCPSPRPGHAASPSAPNP